MRIRTKDGKTFQGETALELVKAMQADAVLLRHVSLRGYMAGVARRVRFLTGRAVRHGNAEEFLIDLACAGMITTIEQEG